MRRLRTSWSRLASLVPDALHVLLVDSDRADNGRLIASIKSRCQLERPDWRKSSKITKSTSWFRLWSRGFWQTKTHWQTTTAAVSAQDACPKTRMSSKSQRMMSFEVSQALQMAHPKDIPQKPVMRQTCCEQSTRQKSAPPLPTALPRLVRLEDGQRTSDCQRRACPQSPSPV